jgi:hypothetical protein
VNEGRRKKEEGRRGFIYGDSDKAALRRKIPRANVPLKTDNA